MKGFSPFICFVLFSSAVPQVVGTCYRPDGSRVGTDIFLPCNQVAGTVSMCCGTNRTDSPPDECQPNGLCKNTGDRRLWRKSCTDPTWKSPLCLSLCTDERNGGSSDGNNPVIDCGDGTFCCGSINGTCCNKKQGVAIAATLGGPIPSSTASSVSSSGLNTGVKAGIGVGVTVFVLAIGGACLVAWIVIRRRREQSSAAKSIEILPKTEYDESSNRHEYQLSPQLPSYQPMSEMGTKPEPVEVPAVTRPVELST